MTCLLRHRWEKRQERKKDEDRSKSMAVGGEADYEYIPSRPEAERVGILGT